MLLSDLKQVLQPASLNTSCDLSFYMGDISNLEMHLVNDKRELPMLYFDFPSFTTTSIPQSKSNITTYTIQGLLLVQDDIDETNEQRCTGQELCSQCLAEYELALKELDTFESVNIGAASAVFRRTNESLSGVAFSLSIASATVISCE